MKSRFIVYGLWFMVLVHLLAINDIRYTIYAVESTPSANIQSKLEEFKKEIASKAAKLKQEVNQKLQNKAYAGIVKDKSTNDITIIDNSSPKTIRVSQDTVYEDWDNPKLKYAFKLVEQDDNIAGLGDVDELGNLIAKKVVLLSDQTPEKTILWGKIISVSGQTPIQSGQTVTVRNKDTKTVSVSFAKINTDAKLNDFVIITGLMNKNDTLVASFAYVIPQGGFIRNKKTAIPSPTPKVTSKPSASPQPKTATSSAKKK